MEEKLTDRTMERILYPKVKESKALKPYLDKYFMLDESDPNHSYSFLVESIENYFLKTMNSKNDEGYADSIIKRDQHTGGKGNRNDKPTKALSAKVHSQQCRFHLSKSGCKWPETCKLGKHGPEYKGKGPPKDGGGTARPTGGGKDDSTRPAPKSGPGGAKGWSERWPC